MTVNTHLLDVSSKLVISDKEKEAISLSLGILQAKIKSYFNSAVKETFTFGSYQRSVNLPRRADNHSDVDLMILFSTENGQKKPQTYLDQLKSFTNAKYSSSEIYQSHPTIVLSLNHINFELVPAIYNGGYLIPSPSSSWADWMNTFPYTADKKLTEANKLNNYQIKPLIRLIKYWNATQNYPFDSFSLEEYIVNGYYPGCVVLRDYFYYFWGNFICGSNHSQSTQDKVSRAKKYAKNAYDYESQSMPFTAEGEIKKIIPSL